MKLRERWAECLLALIVASATALSLYWVFKIPILQNPDEDSHIDYAFSIYSAGRLLNARSAPSEWNVPAQVQGAAFERISHQYTLYLIDSVEFQRLRYHANEKVPSDYGTIDYYRRLNLNAPQSPAQQIDQPPRDNPWMMEAYPFGYYALVAIWLKLLSLFNSGPVVLFFGARVFSVILLSCSLVLTYALMRELRFSKARSLALTAIVGIFPLTTFVSASIQPDNLTWTLMSVSFYIALLLRRKPATTSLLAMLGIALGFLLVTKYHFYILTMLAILGTVVSDHFFKRRSGRSLLRILAILILPSLLFFAIQLWVVSGGERITGGNLEIATAGKVEGVKKALTDFYRTGSAFFSWWGTYGWMDAPLIIVSPRVQRLVLLLLSVLTPMVLVLTLFRLEQVLTRLVVFVGRGRWRTALRLAFSNPLMISHFLFTVFIIVLYVWTNNSFFAQGRHWFPYTLSGFLITTQFAPRALSHRKTQRAVSALLILGLGLYCVVGAYYSILTIKQRYYDPQTSARSVTGSSTDTSHASFQSHHQLGRRVAVKVPMVERNL